MSDSTPITPEAVRKVAHLSRLALSERELEDCRRHLGAVLGYMARLRALDLDGVEPMTSPIEASNRLADDEPGPTLGNGVLMAIAPADAGAAPFVRVPRVIGGGSEGA